MGVQQGHGVDGLGVEVFADRERGFADARERGSAGTLEQEPGEVQAVLVFHQRRPAVELDGERAVDLPEQPSFGERDFGNVIVRRFREAAREVREDDGLVRKVALEQRAGPFVVRENGRDNVYVVYAVRRSVRHVAGLRGARSRALRRAERGSCSGGSRENAIGNDQRARQEDGVRFSCSSTQLRLGRATGLFARRLD